MTIPVELQGYDIGPLIQQGHGLTWLEAVEQRSGESVMVVLFESSYDRSTSGSIALLAKRREEFFRVWAHTKNEPLVGRIKADLIDRPGVVYTLEDGISLREWLANHPRVVTPEEAIRLALQLLDALTHTHRHGVAHRGLSPSVLWVEDSDVLHLRRIFGYGFASLIAVEENWARTGTLRGDVAYMAPEQFLQEPLGAPTDLYSVGLLLYRLLVGYEADVGDTMYAMVQAHCEGTLRPIPTSLPLSENLRACLRKAMQRAPGDRYVSAGEFAYDLRMELDRVTQELPAVVQESTQDLPAAVWPGTMPHRAQTDPSTRPLAPFRVQGNVRQSASWYYDPVRSKRAWTPRRAMVFEASSWEHDPVLSAHHAPQEATSPAPVTSPPSPPPRGRPLLRVGAFLVVAMLTVLASWWGWTRWQQHRAAHEPDVVELAGGDGTAYCAWTHAVRALEQGGLTLSLDDDHELEFDYDRMLVRVRMHEQGRSYALADVRAFGGVAVYHLQRAASGRDWIFLKPRVQNTQRPKIWALQLSDGKLVSLNAVTISTDTVESARLQLQAVAGECMLSIYVEGDLGGGPSAKNMVVRMVDPGLVVQSGALGDLWAPEQMRSPLEGTTIP